MVTTIRKYTGGAYPYYEYACLSTDVKPVNLVPENSICHEIDTGKHYYLANGEWHQLPARGGEGGGLPADFPAEGSANANKFLGFDANGDYTAKDAPSGGGAKKFIVTLTKANDTWTADKTVAEIVAAYEADQVVVAQYVADGFTVELPINTGISMQGVAVAIFIGFENAGEDNKNVTVVCANEGSGEDIQVTQNLIPASSSAPLVVTLSESGGAITGDKTYQEVKEARLAGRPVDLVMTGLVCSSVLDVSVGEVDGESEISVTFIFNGQLASESGAPSDYVGITS